MKFRARSVWSCTKLLIQPKRYWEIISKKLWKNILCRTVSHQHLHLSRYSCKNSLRNALQTNNSILVCSRECPSSNHTYKGIISQRRVYRPSYGTILTCILISRTDMLKWDSHFAVSVVPLQFPQSSSKLLLEIFFWKREIWRNNRRTLGKNQHDHTVQQNAVRQYSVRSHHSGSSYDKLAGEPDWTTVAQPRPWHGITVKAVPYSLILIISDQWITARESLKLNPAALRIAVHWLLICRTEWVNGLLLISAVVVQLGNTLVRARASTKRETAELKLRSIRRTGEHCTRALWASLTTALLNSTDRTCKWIVVSTSYHHQRSTLRSQSRYESHGWVKLVQSGYVNQPLDERDSRIWLIDTRLKLTAHLSFDGR